MAAKKKQSTQEELAGLTDLVDGFEIDPASVWPWIQFSHREGAFEMPLDNLDLEVAPKLPEEVSIGGQTHTAETRAVRHGRTKEPAWLSQALHLSFLGRQPTVFEKKQDGRTVLAPEGLEDPIGVGYYSRDRHAVLCREVWQAGHQGVLALTVKSSSAGHINAVLRELQSFTKVANRVLGEALGRRVSLPPWAFWVPLYVGEGSQTEAGGEVFPIEHALPADPTLEEVKSLLVTKAIRDFVQNPETQEALQEWKTRRSRADNDDSLYVDDEPPLRPARCPRRPAGGQSSRQTGSRGQRSDGGTDAFRRVRVLLARAQDIPEAYKGFNGKTFGEIVDAEGGWAFVEWLAFDHRPENGGEEKVMQKASALLDTRAAEE